MFSWGKVDVSLAVKYGVYVARLSRWVFPGGGGLWIWRKGEKETRDQEKNLIRMEKGGGDKDIDNNTEEITRKNVQKRGKRGKKGGLDKFAIAHSF